MRAILKQKSLLLPVALLLELASCSRTAGSEYIHEEGIAWNTVYHVTYRSSESLADSIIAVINEIDLSLSPFNPSSRMTALNENRTDSVDGHFISVYSKSREISRLTGGAFDPTLAPLIRAWGFGQGHEVSADTLRLDSLLHLVGIDKTALQGNRLVKENPSIEFNFSALAKGYGVDCVADMLERNGVEDYLVEIGGEIRAKGKNPNGEVWRIGIDQPDPDCDGDIQCVVTLTDAALATSGNYRNFHEVDGQRFGHTISATTGRPVTTDVLSATIMAPTCVEADAIATSCMALGKEKAVALCDSLRLGYLLILSDYTVISKNI